MIDRGQWQVAGSAPEVYERELVPAVFGPWAPIVVELAYPLPGERVVDIACGTGIVARVAAARVGATGAVMGVDLNPGMLSVARSVADKRAARCTHPMAGSQCRQAAVPGRVVRHRVLPIGSAVLRRSGCGLARNAQGSWR